ncbi:hypothetical protein PIROE2DRAFT_1560 [Piromyces sp. E2]|nr:hypothetical protein PIROE2DRAFT_1560 [Piromyces sp. E2]|eukprot:OUM70398.1 hypothetical protein PIROE2DRAFT_1560 [Piromyces sp. E2]
MDRRNEVFVAYAAIVENEEIENMEVNESLHHNSCPPRFLENFVMMKVLSRVHYLLNNMDGQALQWANTDESLLVDNFYQGLNSRLQKFIDNIFPPPVSQDYLSYCDIKIVIGINETSTVYGKTNPITILYKEYISEITFYIIDLNPYVVIFSLFYVEIG